MIKLNGHIIKPTIFPDKTSQVWQIVPTWVEPFSKVEWEFESEAELMHLAQLDNLIRHKLWLYDLYVPYLPYGRQDKIIANDFTFALHTFAQLINTLSYNNFITLDAHSPKAIELIKHCKNEMPIKEIQHAVKEVGLALPVLPDQGAYKRYGYLFEEGLHVIKIRDQKTGHLKIAQISGFLGGYDEQPIDIRGANLIIIDDICDGGMTFKLLADELYQLGANEVHLYVTHGIFSKGLDTLRESGIKRVFTRKGEIK